MMTLNQAVDQWSRAKDDLRALGLDDDNDSIRRWLRLPVIERRWWRGEDIEEEYAIGDDPSSTAGSPRPRRSNPRRLEGHPIRC
jgi:hypothetical protein